MSVYIFGLYLLIGYCRYSTDLAKQLIESLHNVLTSCGSVRISFSRRTPEKVRQTPVSNFYHFQVITSICHILLSPDSQFIARWVFC